MEMTDKRKNNTNTTNKVFGILGGKVELVKYDTRRHYPTVMRQNYLENNTFKNTACFARQAQYMM